MIKKFVLVYLLSILFLLLIPAYLFSMGFKENELNGNNLYKEDDFEGAAVEYSEGLAKKADYNLYYNRGVSYYKLGQYEKSYSDFENSATYANSEGDQIKAVYNAGNSSYMIAETVRNENPGQAMKFFEKAINQYERVLELDVENHDASFNLELARLKLDELKQQQGEDQQSEDQEEGDQQSENDSEDGQQDNSKQEGTSQEQNQKDGEQQNTNQQQKNQQSESPEPSYLSEEISPKDILNEEARRQEEMQALIISGSGELVDKDW